MYNNYLKVSKFLRVSPTDFLLIEMYTCRLENRLQFYIHCNEKRAGVTLSKTSKTTMKSYLHKYKDRLTHFRSFFLANKFYSTLGLRVEESRLALL